MLSRLWQSLDATDKVAAGVFLGRAILAGVENGGDIVPRSAGLGAVKTFTQ